MSWAVSMRSHWSRGRCLLQRELKRMHFYCCRLHFIGTNPRPAGCACPLFVLINAWICAVIQCSLSQLYQLVILSIFLKTSIYFCNRHCGHQPRRDRTDRLSALKIPSALLLPLLKALFPWTPPPSVSPAVLRLSLLLVHAEWLGFLLIFSPLLPQLMEQPGARMSWEAL